VGLLCDAFADEEFCRALVGAFQQSGEIPFGEGRLKFSRISALKDLLKDPASQLTISRPGIEGSATAVIIGDGLFLKAYRLLQEGTNPELEMGRYLTEIFPYPHAVPLAGALEYQKPDGRSATLALLQGYVKNQGDVWSYTQKYLERFFEDSLVAPPEERVPPSGDSHGAFLMLMETLGRRTGELHQALSRKTDDPAFDPEPIGLADLSAWKGRVIDDALLTLGRLEQRLDALAEPARARAQTLLGKRALLLDRIRALEFKGLGAVKTRFHGDYHLGQVLLAESDFIIVGFEGEPARPVAERRAKSSPLRDVAGMLRSFDYAARAALNVFTALRPADLVFLEPLARDWQQRSAQAFLQGYEKTVKGCLAYPDRPEHAHSLIELFGLEKILYEIRYELDNRPEWTAVPLASLLEQLP
ncbi:MAG: putative maltokinase, partial [Nitrospinae bacterium]|nr:putative maltokinase [Nitrospinota bacterium]